MLSASKLLKDTLSNLHRSSLLSCFVIDEAHCVSQWGHDFRPDYFTMCDFFKTFHSPKVPILALTATATPKTIIDIRRLLGISNAKMFISSFVRSNIVYEVVPKSAAVFRKLINYIKQRYSASSGIIYCLSRYALFCALLLVRLF